MSLTGLVFVAACCAATEFQPLPIALPEGPHPSAFLTSAEVASMRQRAETLDWAKGIRDGLISNADALAAEAMDIPHAGGQWTHWYTCKACGGGLNAKSPTEHVCESCGAVYTGWPYDDVYVTNRHSHWLGGVETLGLAYAFDPKPVYAERIRAILLEYASFYGGLEIHDVNNRHERGGRLLSQTLDESCMLCRVCLGYDMVYEAPCFSEQDRETIANGLLRAMVKTIQANAMGISNWQSWHNAAVGCTGFVLRDPALVDWAINGKNGFQFQMEKSLTPSGMWFEESPSYHWYALSAHVYLMEASARAGMDLYALPIVKRMFDAPIRQLLPDLTFVPFQDSDRSSILGQRSFYELAYAHYKDPNYLLLIPHRDSLWALLWGADELPPASGALTMTSSNDADEGIAVLRDAANETVLYMDYGPGRSGHVQPAKLGMVLYAHGDIRFVDPGRMSYGNPMHKGWFRQTVAHNTVVVNRASQRIAPGELRDFEMDGGRALIRAACVKAYKEPVTLDRALCMQGNIVADVFTCAAESVCTFDLPLHCKGALTGLPAAEPAEALGVDNGYENLKNVQRFTEPVTAFDVDCGEGRRIHVTLHESSQVFQAEGYGEDMRETLPLILRRQEGTAARFVAVYQILKAGETPQTVEAGENTVSAGDFSFGL